MANSKKLRFSTPPILNFFAKFSQIGPLISRINQGQATGMD